MCYLIDLATYMLVTSECWWQFSGISDIISILVASFGCCWLTLMLKDGGCWWQNRPKPSPTSQSCRQHISSPTSVTNIDVAVLVYCFFIDIFDVTFLCFLNLGFLIAELIFENYRHVHWRWIPYVGYKFMTSYRARLSHQRSSYSTY